MSDITRQSGLPPMDASWWQEYDELYSKVFAIHHRIFNLNNSTLSPEEVYYLGSFMDMTSRIQATFGREKEQR